MPQTLGSMDETSSGVRNFPSKCNKLRTYTVSYPRKTEHQQQPCEMLRSLKDCLIYVHTHTHTHTHTHKHTHTHTHTYIHTYIDRQYMHAYIHTYVHTYIHTYVRTYVHTYIHTYLRTYIHKCSVFFDPGYFRKQLVPLTYVSKNSKICNDN